MIHFSGEIEEKLLINSIGIFFFKDQNQKFYNNTMYFIHSVENLRR